MILIISPNLEPALCGVSDYVLELRRLLLKKNQEVNILAMADIYISDSIENDFSYRIPYSFRNNQKIDYALHYIQKLNPKEIYFNLVSYGYQKKGFPFYLIRLFKSTKLKINIIAHELWMGNFRNESLKSKLVGVFQKQLLIKLLRPTNIGHIFVSTDVSKNILHSFGIKAKTIPVFSNIPINLQNEPQFLESNTIVFILFGSLAFQVNTDAFIEFIKMEFLNKGKNVRINHVGIYRGYTAEWELIKNILAKHKVIFKEYGVVNAAQISTLLQNANYGLTSYMPQFWSKSGAIAAMLAHGLPIFSISKALYLGKFESQLKLNPRIINICDKNINYTISEIDKISCNEFYNDNIFNEITEED